MVVIALAAVRQTAHNAGPHTTLSGFALGFRSRSLDLSTHHPPDGRLGFKAEDVMLARDDEDLEMDLGVRVGYAGGHGDGRTMGTGSAGMAGDAEPGGTCAWGVVIVLVMVMLMLVLVVFVVEVERC